MQVTPIILLIAVFFIELINAIMMGIFNFSPFPGLLKWTLLIEGFLSLLATVFSIALLIMKKYSTMLMGFGITLLSTLIFTVFATWAFRHWILG